MADKKGESSRTKALRIKLQGKAQDKTEKCQHCFLFDKFCDQIKPTCGGCVDENRTCKPQKVAPKYKPQRPNAQDPWKKCQSCRKVNAKCVYTGTSLRCTHCEKKKLTCVEQFRPVWRTVNRRNAQPKEHKCRACFIARSFCDQQKPSCGKCVQYKSRCVPRGTPMTKPVHVDDKCRRCKQLQLACSHTLPCERCKERSLNCGASHNEEAFAREGEAERAREREAELEGLDDGHIMEDEMMDDEVLAKGKRAGDLNRRHVFRAESNGRTQRVSTVQAPVKVESDSDEDAVSVAALAQARKQKARERQPRQSVSELPRRSTAIAPRFTGEDDDDDEETISEYDPDNESEIDTDVEMGSEGSNGPLSDMD